MGLGPRFLQNQGAEPINMLLTEDSHCILRHRDIKVKWKRAVLPGQLMGTGDPSFRRKASSLKFGVRTPGQRWSWSGTELGGEEPCL